MKRVAILQSNYIPWKGYFDIIDFVDEFIILDAQYTKRDWRNRNLIKTPIGLQWLTVPVTGSGLVSEMEVDGERWKKQHWNAIESNYARAPYFKDFGGFVASLYEQDIALLNTINGIAIGLICSLFNIRTPIWSSENLDLKSKKTQRLVDICRYTKASHYLTGPAAKNYLNESLFGDIEVEWMGYDYPEYRQLYGDFVHEVSILDVLFNVGPDKRFIQTHADIRSGRVC